MRIAIIKQNEVNNLAYAGYLYNLLLEAAREHHYEIVDAGNKLKDTPSSGSTLFIVHNNATIQLGLKWFYEVHLPSLVKKLNADVVIHLNGILSSSVKQPQLIVLPGLDALQNTSVKKSAQSQYINKKLSSALAKASALITYSAPVKTFIEERGEASGSITIIPVAAEEFFKPVEWEQKELLKAEHTGGSEFFLINRNFTRQEDLLQLLKAFSVFKKWQQSSMKLVIAGALLFDEADEKIATYKYRNDVKIIPVLPAQEYATLLACSYCFLHLSADETDLLAVMQAMQSGTAVITNTNHSYKTIFGENVLYNEDGDPQTLGNNLIRIYKNEQLRNLVIRGSLQLANSVHYNDIKLNLLKLVIEAAGK